MRAAGAGLPEQVEAAVLDRRYHDAAAALASLLDAAAEGRVTLPNDPDDACDNATRLTASIVALLAAAEFDISDDEFWRLVFHQEMLADIAGASCYENLDPAISANLTILASATDDAGSKCALLRCLLSLTLASRIDVPFEMFLRAAPKAAMATYFALVGSGVATGAAFTKRSELYRLVGIVDPAQVDERLLPLLNRAWFMCSYDERPDKHEFKKHVNAIVRALLERQGVEPQTSLDARDRLKPVVAVVADVMHSAHAMFRCYAAPIAGLKKKFETVLVADPDRIDDDTRNLVNRVVEIDRKATPAATIAKVREIKPDILFIPGTGMSAWSLALLNTRNAPVQVVSQGHPATTMSPHVDYSVGPDGWMGLDGCYSETALQLDGGAMQFVQPRTDADQPQISADATKITADQRPRLAINSKSFKLSRTFLETVAEIVERATIPVDPVFFVTEAGFRYHHIARLLRTMISGAVVEPMTDFASYLRTLATCDIHLGTFPFGGTNTVADSLNLHIPVLTLEGHQPHSRIDASMIRRAGLPEDLIAVSRSDYVAKGLRLVEDDEFRAGLTRHLREFDLAAEFEDVEYRTHKDDLVECFGWLVGNHDVIAAEGRTTWTIEDRLSRSDSKAAMEQTAGAGAES